MGTSSAPAAKSLAVEAYVHSIRSVLFIDDQFPTYDKPQEDRIDADRARELWAACRDRGWLCDIDNVADWNSVERKRRLGACDLLVLDFHLQKDDATPAIELVRQLSRIEDSNLVTVYTAEANLRNVLLRLAASVRGVSEEVVGRESPEKFSDIGGDTIWADTHVVSRLCGTGDWFLAVKDAASAAGVTIEEDPAPYEVAIDDYIKKIYGVEPQEKVTTIDRLNFNQECQWFQVGNLFVAVVGKRGDSDSRAELDVLVGGLSAAVSDWAPPPIACAIAASRHAGNKGAFGEDIARLHDDDLTNGLLHFIRSEQDESERNRKSTAIANDLLQRRFEVATATLARQLCDQPFAGQHAPAKMEHITRLNAFLCSNSHDRVHLDLGTIFRDKDASRYWLCVTPACDMVPRVRAPSDKGAADAPSSKATDALSQPKPEVNPQRGTWKDRLGSNLSFTAIELQLLAPEGKQLVPQPRSSHRDRQRCRAVRSSPHEKARPISASRDHPRRRTPRAGGDGPQYDLGACAGRTGAHHLGV